MKFNLNNSIYKMFYVFIVLVISLCASGCTDNIIEEKQVFEDIKNADDYCSSFDFTYSSMKIVKRMTNQEEKIDEVWVDFVCFNEDFRYEVESKIEYVLYNEGWLFEDYIILDSKYVALKFPDENDLINDFDLYQNENVKVYATNLQRSSSQNECSIVVSSGERISEYFSWEHQHTYNYYFTPETGWNGEEVEVSSIEKWNLDKFIGEWQFTSERFMDSYGKLNIGYIDEEVAIVDSYEVTYFESNTAPPSYEEGKGEYYVTYNKNFGFFASYNFPFYQFDIIDHGSYWIKVCATPYGLYENVGYSDGKMYLGQEYIRVSSENGNTTTGNIINTENILGWYFAEYYDIKMFVRENEFGCICMDYITKDSELNGIEMNYDLSSADSGGDITYFFTLDDSNYPNNPGCVEIIERNGNYIFSASIEGFEDTWGDYSTLNKQE